MSNKTLNTTYTIEITFYPNIQPPDDEKYIGSIRELPGTVESGYSPGDCLINLGKSLIVKENYDKKVKP